MEQGGRPVSGAAVTVLVDRCVLHLPLHPGRDDGGLPVEVALQDDGLGADLVAGDGLYAKYFINYLANMGQKRYSFSCLVEGGEGTTVNHGHNLTQGREVRERGNFVLTGHYSGGGGGSVLWQLGCGGGQRPQAHGGVHQGSGAHTAQCYNIPGWRSYQRWTYTWHQPHFLVSPWQV